MSNGIHPQHSFKSLDVIQIQSPCSMDWNLMVGDNRTRHCDRCSKNVYNISAMGEKESLALINQQEGDICIRLFRRADGTVVTADCPSLEPSSRERSWYQFSMASLMTLVMVSAGLCASAPWIGKKLQPLYDSWFATQTPPLAPTPMVPFPGNAMGGLGGAGLPPTMRAPKGPTGNTAGQNL